MQEVLRLKKTPLYMIAKLLISALVQMLNSKFFEHIYWIAGGVDNQDFQYLTRYEKNIYVYIFFKKKDGQSAKKLHKYLKHHIDTSMFCFFTRCL
jgi:UDP-N-acetylmuramoylalanine-D-glutamate ligase